MENLPFLKELASDLGVFIVHSKSKDTYSLKIDVDGINPNETAEERQERIASVRKTIKRYQQSVLVEDAEELEREKSIYNTRFHDWKQQYYIDKFEFKRNDEEAIRKVAMNYVEGLQWVLFYYYRGCPPGVGTTTTTTPQESPISTWGSTRISSLSWGNHLLHSNN